jgi:hypothetical protein
MYEVKFELYAIRELYVYRSESTSASKLYIPVLGFIKICLVALIMENTDCHISSMRSVYAFNSKNE